MEKGVPVERLHPEAIKVEDLNGDIPSFHPYQERVDSLFIVIRREARAEPQAETPTGYFARFASQDGIFF